MADVDGGEKQQQKVALDLIEPDSLTFIDDSNYLTAPTNDDSIEATIIAPPENFGGGSVNVVAQYSPDSLESDPRTNQLLFNKIYQDKEVIICDKVEGGHCTLTAPDVLANVNHHDEVEINPDVVSHEHDNCLHVSTDSNEPKTNGTTAQKGTAKPKERKERKKKRKNSQRTTKTTEEIKRSPASWAKDKHVDNITDTTVRIEKTEVQEEKDTKKTVIDTVNIHSTRTTFTKVQPNGTTTNNTTTTTHTTKQEVNNSNTAPEKRVKATKRFNVGGYEKCPCVICTKHVYPLEMLCAEKNVYHKTCFRCDNCRKILSLDNYKMFKNHLYCPNHYRQQVVLKINSEEDLAPPPPKKHEMIIRESIPAQLPPDVIRCDDKTEDEIDHISLSKKLRNIKSRLEASVDEQEQPSSLLTVKESPLQRSPSIMDRLAKYQAAATKRQVSDSDSESSSDEVERDPDIVRETKGKEQVKFTRMNSLMSKWESGEVKNENKSRVKSDATEDDEQLALIDKTKSMKSIFESGNVAKDLDVEKAEQLKRNKERDMNVFRYTDDNVETGAIGDKFKFFESYDGSPGMERKKFQMTPPRESENSDSSSSSSEEEERDSGIIRSSYSSKGDIPRTDTAKKMLNKFKALESNSRDTTDNKPVRPMRKMTPPRDFPELSDTEEMDEGSSSSSAEIDQDSSIKEKSKEHIPVEADKAKNLRSKFENWQTQNNKENIRRNTDRLPSSSCRNLRAKFEAVKDETPKPKGTPPPKVNRFMAYQATIAEQEKCAHCSKRVYALEKITVNKILLHRTCFKCSVCCCVLSMNTYTTLNDVLYCTTHFKQLFARKGNYDEGFGREQHKDKWCKSSPTSGNDVNFPENSPISTNGHDNSGKKVDVPVTTNGLQNEVKHGDHVKDSLNGNVNIENIAPRTSNFMNNFTAVEEKPYENIPISNDTHDGHIHLEVDNAPKSPSNETHTQIQTTIQVEELPIEESSPEPSQKSSTESDCESEEEIELTLDYRSNISELFDKMNNELQISGVENDCSDDEPSLSVESDLSESVSHTEGTTETDNNEDNSYVDKEEEAIPTAPPPTTTCKKVATTLHGVKNDIYEINNDSVSTDNSTTKDELLYENITFLKENRVLKQASSETLSSDAKSSDMERSFASDDSIANYLRDSEELEGFNVREYMKDLNMKYGESDEDTLSK